MNKRMLHAVLITLIVVIVPGCSNDRLDMEDASLPLAIGIDLDPQAKLNFYVSSPAFSKDVKKKSQEISEKAPTFRESRSKQDSHSSGVFQGRNAQVLLLGKQLLQHEDWFRMLDVLFRDAKNTVNDRVIAVNGPIEEIIYLNPQDQPLMPLLLREMVNTKNTKSETVETTLQEFHRQIYEKGMTPYISEVRVVKGKEIVLSGTTLLDHKGLYTATLSAQETILLRILQKTLEQSVSLTLPISGEPMQTLFDTDKLSLSASGIKTKIKTSYHQDKFKFDINIRMPVTLTELLSPYDVGNQGKQLEKAIAKQVQEQFKNLIVKIQKLKIDPIGLGIYARAYEFKAYKKVEEHWGEALSKADINVDTNISIVSMGPIK